MSLRTKQRRNNLLTSYDGKTITYDAIGNPLTYGNQTFTWKQGRQLATLNDGIYAWSYTYDANGMRKSRSSGSIIYTYTYNGSKLTQMVKGSNTLYFTYDALGAPWTVRWNGTVYNYMTNLQGDVIAIVNTSNVAVVEYAYDAWGNILGITGSMANTLGTLNPLTYRGYVYDYETQLYYLQSRYYYPEWGRFINADAFISTGGLLGNNMFAYCGNNPVNREDPTGHAAMQMSFNPDGVPKMMGPGLWGGGSGGVAYAANAVTSIPKETVKQFHNNVRDVFRSGAKTLWNAYVHSVELQAQMQYQQDMAVIAMWEDTFSSPIRAGDFAAMSISNVGTYCAFVSFVAAPTVGSGVLLVLSVGSALWSTARYLGMISE